MLRASLMSKRRERERARPPWRGASGSWARPLRTGADLKGPYAQHGRGVAMRATAGGRRGLVGWWELARGGVPTRAEPPEVARRRGVYVRATRA